SCVFSSQAKEEMLSLVLGFVVVYALGVGVAALFPSIYTITLVAVAAAFVGAFLVNRMAAKVVVHVYENDGTPFTTFTISDLEDMF
ncbi:hypothetical protein PMAYCL1PPCAC_20907, partial [Pristionchus mayeri]